MTKQIRVRGKGEGTRSKLVTQKGLLLLKYLYNLSPAF